MDSFASSLPHFLLLYSLEELKINQKYGENSVVHPDPKLFCKLGSGSVINSGSHSGSGFESGFGSGFESGSKLSSVSNYR